MSDKIELNTTVPEKLSGKRLDQALAELYPEHSRSRLQNWIAAGKVSVNNKNLRQRDKVRAGDSIYINTLLIAEDKHEPESIPLDIVHEDEALLIINKPSGLVVHPGAGNPKHTLINALLNYDSGLKLLPRAGIIHRLDKDTTGLMVVAKTLTAHTRLVELLQNRDIKREYEAIVCGQITAGDTIETNIGRHPTHRTKMAVTKGGKEATTHYRLIKKYLHYTHLLVELETGRTHQIRVHLSHIKHAIIGDMIYGKNQSSMKGLDKNLREIIINFKRQALHARRLIISHPLNDELQVFEATIPEDMSKLIVALNKYDQRQ